MPLQSPKSLTNNEVYAVSAYILFLNGIISEDYELNQKNLADVKMPNRNGMIDYSKEKAVSYK
jgi:cytochrome c